MCVNIFIITVCILYIYIIINLFSNALYAMESLWQVDYTSLLNEVCLRYLWPLIDEIG